ncbi:hypothetical protein ACLOJK_023555 [Asimina triloba]
MKRMRALSSMSPATTIDRRPACCRLIDGGMKVNENVVGGVAAVVGAGIGLIGVDYKNSEMTMLPSGSLIAVDRSRGKRLWPARARMPPSHVLLSCSSTCGFDGSTIALSLPSFWCGSIGRWPPPWKMTVQQPWLTSFVEMVEHRIPVLR